MLPDTSYFTAANLAKTYFNAAVLFNQNIWRRPDKPLLVEIDDEWVVGGDEHIQPQVGLVTVDQQRVVDILAHDQGLVQGDLGQENDESILVYTHFHLVWVLDQVNSSSPGRRNWFHNP